MKAAQAILVFAAGIALLSCGGGDGDAPVAAPGATATAEPTSSPASDPGTGAMPAPTTTTTTLPPPGIDPGDAPSFAAAVTQAPADGATIGGTVRLVVQGQGIQNIALLPASGYAPVYATGTMNEDGTGGLIDFDTTVLPAGLFSVRVAAFDAPPGDGGNEVTAMPAHTWVVINPPATAPVLIQLADLPYRDPAPLAALVNLDDAQLQARLTDDWPTVEALLRLYIPKNVDFDFPVPLGFYGPWASCLQGHTVLACREHMTLLIGLMNSKRP